MDFSQYKKEDNPEKERKIYAWQTAIGLQKVDNLTPSKYLYHIAKENIENNLTFKEAHTLINNYYEEKTSESERTEEADKVSLRIAELISSNSFVFSTIEYLNIHKQLFDGIYDHAGKIRTFNISKSEWVLDGESVSYGNAYSLNKKKNLATRTFLTRNSSVILQNLLAICGKFISSLKATPERSLFF